MNILITGGGTGGHLTIVKSLKEEFSKRDINLYYVGSTKGQDIDWFQNDKDFKKTIFLKTGGVVNQKSIGKLFALINIFYQSLKIVKFLLKYKIYKTVSVGGFSSAPASFATILLRRELYIHEQNSVMGSLNKILKPFAKTFFSSYLENSFKTSYPINKIFFEKYRVRKDIKTIIFIGGSQGARAINNFALLIAKDLIDKNIKIIHQTGKNDFNRVKDEYKKLNINMQNINIFAFSKSLVNEIDKADFAISRAGASTLWELCAIGIPTLFIPYPFAAKNHQYFNAKFLVDKNLALLLKEKDLNKNILIEILNLDIQSISNNLKTTIQKDGISQIADKIIPDSICSV